MGLPPGSSITGELPSSPEIAPSGAHPVAPLFSLGGTPSAAMGSPAKASVAFGHASGPSRVLEGIPQAVIGDMSDRALSGLEPVRENPLPPDQSKTHFHQINRKTGHRLRQQMVDENTSTRATRAAATKSPRASTSRLSPRRSRPSRSRAPTRSTSRNSFLSMRSTAGTSIGRTTSFPMARPATMRSRSFVTP
jgi:hypothetical protein